MLIQGRRMGPEFSSTCFLQLFYYFLPISVLGFFRHPAETLNAFGLPPYPLEMTEVLRAVSQRAARVVSATLHYWRLHGYRRRRSAKNQLDQQHCFWALPPRGTGRVIHVQFACLCGRDVPLLDDDRPRHQHGIPSAAHAPVLSGALAYGVFLCGLWSIDPPGRPDFLGGHAPHPPDRLRSARRSAFAARWRMVGSHRLAAGGREQT